MSVVCGKAEAYLKLEGIGAFALTKPVKRPPLAPKRFLVQISPERLKELEEQKCPLTPATVKCTTTNTRTRFCIISYEGIELEGMEMAHPICKLSKIVKHKLDEKEAIDECLKEGKRAFLIVKETRK